MIIKKIFDFLKRIHWVFYILIGFVITQVINLLMSIIAPKGSNYNPVVNEYAEGGVFGEIISKVILAPMLETMIFQLVPYFILWRFLNGNYRLWAYIVVSSVLFALDHRFGTYYFFLTFLIGSVLALWFYIGKLRGQNAFLIVFAIHALNNLLAVLEIYIAL